MLKKILKAIQNQLLKVDWIKAEAYKLIQEKRQDDQLFAKIIHAGQAVHVDDTDSPDSTIVVDYVDGRMVGQRQVTPTIIRPFGLNRDKF